MNGLVALIAGPAGAVTGAPEEAVTGAPVGTVRAVIGASPESMEPLERTETPA
jgi:hypothetical protein